MDSFDRTEAVIRFGLFSASPRRKGLIHIRSDFGNVLRWPEVCLCSVQSGSTLDRR